MRMLFFLETLQDHKDNIPVFNLLFKYTFHTSLNTHEYILIGLYLKGHPYWFLIYESHLVGIQGSPLVSFSLVLKDRNARST